MIVITIGSPVVTRGVVAADQAAEVEVEAGAAGEEADGQMETATTPMLSRTEGTERWRNVWDCDRTDTRVACSMHALCFVVHSVRLPPGFCIMCIHNV